LSGNDQETWTPQEYSVIGIILDFFVR